jgi:hypothetical protein
LFEGDFAGFDSGEPLTPMRRDDNCVFLSIVASREMFRAVEKRFPMNVMDRPRQAAA